ncbi:excitatory amino acid transporter-like isoform X2 [Babylonia areolata]|uniref:excitatory amino acid transporter-like isoform X2 n=1 Tax=Babylonia areolata TaxID=304850 RepID=UPI003FD4B6A4
MADRPKLSTEDVTVVTSENSIQSPAPEVSEEAAEESSGNGASQCQRFLRWDPALLVLSVIGAAVGFAIGLTLYYVGVSSDALVWVGMPGELFMRMLKAAVLPLIVSSIIAGTAGLKPKENGRVSAVALTYIIITNITGAVVGTVLAVLIKPGSSGADTADTTTVDTGNLQTSDLFADLVRNLVPDNVVAACFQKTQTRYKEGGDAHNATSLVRFLDVASGTNILGLVIVSTAVGMAAAQTGEVARPFLHFFSAAADVIIRLVHWVIWLTPIGVASLIAKAIASTADLEATFKGLGFFVLAEVIGNFITGFIFIALIYFVIIRKNPFKFLLGASRAIITGVATASSAATMPEVLNCVEEKNNVDIRVSRFVVPMATALNRDGSAMFIACCCVYIAQLQGSVTASNTILIAILSAVGSLAIPGVPSASIVTILMILSSLDIPPANLGIIIALEWFSDRMRAVPNMSSHVLCAVITWHFCRKSLGFDQQGAAPDLTELQHNRPPSAGDIEKPTEDKGREEEKFIKW